MSTPPTSVTHKHTRTHKHTGTIYALCCLSGGKGEHEQNKTSSYQIILKIFHFSYEMIFFRDKGGLSFFWYIQLLFSLSKFCLRWFFLTSIYYFTLHLCYNFCILFLYYIIFFFRLFYCFITLLEFNQFRYFSIFTLYDLYNNKILHGLTE